MPIDDALSELKKSEENKKPEPKQISLDDYLKIAKKKKADLDKIELWQLKESDLETLVDKDILSPVIAKKYLSAQNELILGLKARMEPAKFKTMFNSGCGLMLSSIACVPLMLAGMMASYAVFLKCYGYLPDKDAFGVRLLLSGTGILTGLAISSAMFFSCIHRSERKGKKLLQKSLEINLDDAYSRYINALESITKLDGAKITVSCNSGNYDVQKIIDAALNLKKNTEALDTYFNKLRELE